MPVELSRKTQDSPARKPRSPDGDVSRLTTTELMARIAQDAQGLVKAELRLARTELHADVVGVLGRVQRMAIAFALLTAAAAAVLTAGVLALALVMPAWAAALAVAALLLGGGLIAGRAAKGDRKEPLERTRRHIKEDLEWAKEVRT
jgi:hypothetical protein